MGTRVAAERTYEYTLDKEGRLFHDGTEVVNEGVLRLCFRSLERDADGRYLFRCAGERNYVRPEDAPYVVRSVSVRRGRRGQVERIDLDLGSSVREKLDPATLEVGGGNVLYARVRGGLFPARFTRAAYYQIADLVEGDGQRFVLRVGGTAYEIGQTR